MSAVTATAPPTVEAELEPGRARTIGVGVGAGLVVVCAVGMALSFNNRMVIQTVLSMGWLTLGMLPLLGGWIAARREVLEGVDTAPPGGIDVARAAIAGLWAGGIFALFVILLDAVGDSLRGIFIQLSPALLAMLTFDRGIVFGVVVALLLPLVMSTLGGALRVGPRQVWRSLGFAAMWIVGVAVFEAVFRSIISTLSLDFLRDLLYASGGGLRVLGAGILAAVVIAAVLGMSAVRGDDTAVERRARSAGTQAAQLRLYGGMLVAAIVLPYLFDRSVNDMMINVVIFGIMALGLNIVIGLAGMLDLGYVAFFAVGAYTTAVLTTTSTDLAFSPELSFWLALPVALAVAVVAGLIIGTPVIRLRGDYLAIVTLGFAAIAQVLVLSDWFAPVLGGPQGVGNVPPVPLGFTEVSATVDPRGFLWLSLGFLALMMYVAWRLQHSRLGRAWQAIREDETVAEAMGINVASHKLLAFCVGSVFAALAGGLFAAKVSSAFPTSFELLVSVLVLVVVIVGGTGYVPGVLLGSVVLVGVLGGPTTQGLLAEFAQYKLLIYGALLVVMMLVRPQGLMPKPEKAREIAEDEMDQDAWFDKNVGGSSDVAAGRRADAAGQVPIETRLRPDDGVVDDPDHDTMSPGNRETTITTDPTEGEA